MNKSEQSNPQPDSPVIDHQAGADSTGPIPASPAAEAMSESDSEYRRILAHWLFLDRGDTSSESAHAHHASFLSID